MSLLPGQWNPGAIANDDPPVDIAAVNSWMLRMAGEVVERLNGQIKRRTNVVGIFPDDEALARLVTAVVVEALDEWAVSERRYLSEESMAKLYEQPLDTVTDHVTEETPLAVTA